MWDKSIQFNLDWSATAMPIYYYLPTENVRKEFYNQLRRAKPNFVWRLTKDGKVRGFLRNRCYCPLTSIAKNNLGKTYPINDIHEDDFVKNIGLGLNETDLEFFANCADYTFKEMRAEGSDKYYAIVRRNILKILDLKEVRV